MQSGRERFQDRNSGSNASWTSECVPAAPGEIAMMTLNALRLHVNSHYVFAIQ